MTKYRELYYLTTEWCHNKVLTSNTLMITILLLYGIEIKKVLGSNYQITKN